jgi:hypothetical protein
LDSALQAAIKRETSSGVGLFTFIGHENYGNAAAYSDADNANFAVKPAIAMKSVDEFELSGADADVFVVYGPVQGVDGALLNVLGQQFDLSAIDTSCKPPLKSVQAKLEFSGIMIRRRRTDEAQGTVQRNRNCSGAERS